MQIHVVDINIIITYLIVIVIAGLLLTKRAGKNIDSYFLGGKSIPWYFLGIANASGMFDIVGTMWMVTILFVYGLKSVWIPWLWPTFNQIFLMIYISVWLRRSNVMTGAEWIRTRFGDKSGGELSHISVVIFALVAVIGMLAYAFVGIGKFAVLFFPWDLSLTIYGFSISSPNMYALILMSITTIYVIVGGMYSVVVTDLLQFVILTVASFFVAGVAMKTVSPEALAGLVPEGWFDIFSTGKLNVDWVPLFSVADEQVAKDGYSLFGIFFMMVLFKGILASMAGPLPNYDMQRVLSTRSPREGALMSCWTSMVLFIPRYLMITGFALLALFSYQTDPGVYLNPAGKVDFEQILPWVINNRLPVGLVGITLAGLLAAFMSTFDCTVNSGASYVVNDIFKRYIKPNASAKTYVYISYVSSILIVIIGITFGFYLTSIDQILKWITAGLGAGYIAANFLKWYWWRFNGFGYFAGMITGTLAAIVLPPLVPILLPGFCAWFASNTNNFPLVLALFPVILILSTIACVVTSLLTKSDDEEVLKKFYSQVRPWGFWDPVYKKVAGENPSFKKNTAFKRDMINVAVGIVWQMSLIILPVYFVLRKYNSLWITLNSEKKLRVF